MTHPALRDLLDRMTKKETVSDSSQSTSWQAHREAEKLLDESMIDEIVPILRNSKSKDEKMAGYFVLGCIGRNVGTSRAAALLVEQSGVENDKYVLSSLLDALAKLDLSQEIPLDSVFRLLEDPRWLVRQSAIRSLCGASSPEVEDHILKLLAATMDPNDQIYCHVTLGRIGTQKAVPFLEARLASRKRDVKMSARAALESIHTRHGLVTR